mgnify:FL=1
MKVGSLVYDRHYGHGIVIEDKPYDASAYKAMNRMPWVRVHFPQMAHMASRGVVKLAGRDQVKGLKVISE